MLNLNKKIAIFRFEASELIGAGHAVRCSVLADILADRGWLCIIVTNKKTYEFIKYLSKFERINPDEFYKNPFIHDLLVVDNYDVDYSYENYFRNYAKKIFVLDDLANRKHDCDIILDQTYGREAEDYRQLVPAHCNILVGSDYILLRSQFIRLRQKALEKRRNTKVINRILISVGGSDLRNYTLMALKLVKESGFTGAIDVVVGFIDNNNCYQKIKEYTDLMPNDINVHIDPDMATLIYDADLAIGAAGSSVWERCCLGLPSVILSVASNQEIIYKNLINSNICYPLTALSDIIKGVCKIFDRNNCQMFRCNGIDKVKRILELE